MRHTGFPQVDGGQLDPWDLGRHNLGEYKSHQAETNTGKRETSSNQREALESPTSRTMDL